MKSLKINRGLPGSGKSTLANKIFSESDAKLKAIYSTDDYFMHDGKYVFDGRKIRKAHEWNYNRFLQAVHNDYELIIVDNTHTQFWEMISYLETGLDFGYEIQFLEPNTPWAKDVDQLLEKNTHGVPRASIERMLKRWEPTPEILKGCEEKFECQVNWKTNTIWLDHN